MEHKQRPQGYHGQFRPGIKSLALVFAFGARMLLPTQQG
jgi:hypothetical protein